MSKHQFQFPLSLKIDANGEEYLIGSTDLPMSVDLREATFLVFFPEEGGDKGTLMIRPRNLIPRPHRDPVRDSQED
jgi:hypothetical protein